MRIGEINETAIRAFIIHREGETGVGNLLSFKKVIIAQDSLFMEQTVPLEKPKGVFLHQIPGCTNCS